MEHGCSQVGCMHVCVCVLGLLNEMEIFSECSTQCSGVKCVWFPWEDNGGEGGMAMELQWLIGGTQQQMGLFILTETQDPLDIWRVNMKSKGAKKEFKKWLVANTLKKKKFMNY